MECVYIPVPIDTKAQACDMCAVYGMPVCHPYGIWNSLGHRMEFQLVSQCSRHKVAISTTIYQYLHLLSLDFALIDKQVVPSCLSNVDFEQLPRYRWWGRFDRLRRNTFLLLLFARQLGRDGCSGVTGLGDFCIEMWLSWNISRVLGFWLG